MTDRNIASIVAATRAYYDGPADEITGQYGGRSAPRGPCGDECPHPEAMEHTNEIMANAVALGPQLKVLDFEYGDFHHLEYPDGSYDVVWGQESVSSCGGQDGRFVGMPPGP